MARPRGAAQVRPREQRHLRPGEQQHELERLTHWFLASHVKDAVALWPWALLSLATLTAKR